MKVITIIFFGLIVHVNQPRSFDNTAVLPVAPFHVAKMIIPMRAVSENDDEWLQKQPQVDGNYEIALEGLDVRLKGTTGMFCNKDAIANAVPKLTRFSPKCGRLKQAVRDRDNTSKLAAFVDYRAGTMTVAEYFPKKLGFGSNVDTDPQECVACRVRYEGKLDGDHALFVFTNEKGGTHEIRVSAGSQVEVQNLPTHTLGKHFEFHYEILNDCDDGTDTFIGDECEETDLCRDAETQKNARNVHPQHPLGAVSDPFPTAGHTKAKGWVDGIPQPFPLADCTNSQYP